MADDRFSQALTRIEAATATIEARLVVPGDVPDPALAARHERLRAATAAAMARLDRLIALAEDAPAEDAPAEDLGD